VAATLLRSHFRIRQDNLGAAVQALKEWATHYCTQNPGPAQPGRELDLDFLDHLIARITHPVDAFQVFGWDLVIREGDVIDLQQRDFNNTGEEYENAMAVLHGIVEPHSYLIFHGDDDDLFAWTWEPHGFYVKSGGRIVFGEDATRVKVDPWK
jgi:hypothetical protein